MIDPDNIREAARLLEDISERQQRAAVSNFRRAVMLETAGPKAVRRSLDSLRQSIGHRVPGWEDMIPAMALLTGMGVDECGEHVAKGSSSRYMIDGEKMSRQELTLLRAYRKASFDQRKEATTALRSGAAAQGEEQLVEPAAGTSGLLLSYRRFDIIDGGRSDA